MIIGLLSPSANILAWEELEAESTRNKCFKIYFQPLYCSRRHLGTDHKCFCERKKRNPILGILSSPANIFLIIIKEIQYNVFSNLLPQIFSDAGSLHLQYKFGHLSNAHAGQTLRPIARYLPQIHCWFLLEVQNSKTTAWPCSGGHNEHNLFLFLFWCFKLHSMQYTVHYNGWELVIESCPTVIWILLNMQSKVQYGWSLYYRCHFALKTQSETLFGADDHLPDVKLG